MSGDDFLWTCAFASQGKDRQFLVPDGHDLDPVHQREFHTQNIVCSRSAGGAICEDVVVKVLEERGEGVVDVIGGEVWEAALLLCGLIMCDRSQFTRFPTVVELGAGVGLPALLLAHLETRFSLPDSQLALVVGTDNDSLLLANLVTSANSQLPVGADPSNVSAPFCLSVAPLDWGCPSVDMQGGLLMGSALCYAPIHARLLHDLLLSCLSAQQAKEVVVLQIADREGFQSLVASLRDAGLRCDLQPVPAEVYAYAKRVRRVQRQCDGSKVWYDYFFPAFAPAFSAPAARPTGTSLLHTNREAFCLLRVTPQ